MKWIGNSLRSKILVLLGIYTFLVVCAAFYGYRSAMQSTTAQEEVISVDLANERLALQMAVSFKKQVQEWKNVLLRGSDPEQLTKYWGKFEKQEAAVRRQTESLLGRLDDDTAKGLLEQFAQSHVVMGEAYRKGLQAFKASGFDSRTGDRAVKGIDREPTRLLEQVAATISEHAGEEIEASTVGAHQGMIVSLVTIVLAAVTGFILFAWFSQRGIVQPIRALVTDLDRLAEGDFSQPVVSGNRDEIGDLALRAEKVRHQLGEMIGRVAEASRRLGGTADEVAEATETTRRAMADQQGETGQVVVAMNQMSNTVQEIAHSAASAAEAAAAADRQAHEGSDVVQEAVTSISDLANEISNTAEVIHALEADSEAIGNVLDVIRGIAEQTNLLALNAAIEAARAGEQGRGFAVVADEVRALAQRTQESTQEIQGMIERLQEGSRRAVDAMTKGQEKVGLSVDQANQSGAKLSEILNAIRTINDMNTQIASAAEEQGQVAQEITQSVDATNRLCSETASTSDRLAAVGQHMQEMTVELNRMVDRFRLAPESTAG